MVYPEVDQGGGKGSNLRAKKPDLVERVFSVPALFLSTALELHQLFLSISDSENPCLINRSVMASSSNRLLGTRVLAASSSNSGTRGLSS